MTEYNSTALRSPWTTSPPSCPRRESQAKDLRSREGWDRCAGPQWVSVEQPCGRFPPLPSPWEGQGEQSWACWAGLATPSKNSLGGEGATWQFPPQGQPRALCFLLVVVDGWMGGQRGRVCVEGMASRVLVRARVISFWLGLDLTKELLFTRSSVLKPR